MRGVSLVIVVTILPCGLIQQDQPALHLIVDGLALRDIFGHDPLLAVTTVAFGSKTSVIWNGLRWMWNGWEIGGP